METKVISKKAQNLIKNINMPNPVEILLAKAFLCLDAEVYRRK